MPEAAPDVDKSFATAVKWTKDYARQAIGAGTPSYLIDSEKAVPKRSPMSHGWSDLAQTA